MGFCVGVESDRAIDSMEPIHQRDGLLNGQGLLNGKGLLNGHGRIDSPMDLWMNGLHKNGNGRAF